MSHRNNIYDFFNQSMNKQIILYLLALHTSFIFGCGTPSYSYLQTIHKRHPRDYLYNNIPEELKDSVTYYRALLEQRKPDAHSCGQRSVFHALALEEAMQRMKERNIPVHMSLRFSLSSAEWYENVYATINIMIQAETPWVDLRTGTCGDQLARAANRHFPVLQDKLLPLFLFNEGLCIVDNGIPAHPSSLNAGKFSYSNKRYKFFGNSDEKYLQFSKLKQPYDIIHFLAMLDNQHWVLASVMLNFRREKRLLVIDSCNTFLQNYPSLQTLITLLKEEMRSA